VTRAPVGVSGRFRGWKREDIKRDVSARTWLKTFLPRNRWKVIEKRKRQFE